MDPTSEMLFNQAVVLPERERLILVSRLLQTLPDDAGDTALDEVSLLEELDRRFAEREEGVPWSELRAES